MVVRDLDDERLGFAVELFYLLCNIPLTFLLYDLFKIVNKKLAVVAALFSVVGTAVEGVSLLAHDRPGICRVLLPHIGIPDLPVHVLPPRDRRAAGN